MSGEKKYTVIELNGLNWSAISCSISSCRSGNTAGGTNTYLHGPMILGVANGPRIQFRWCSRQFTSTDKAATSLSVLQDFLTLPTMQGVVLVGKDGQELDRETTLKEVNALVERLKGMWTAKAKHVAQLMR